MTPNFTIDEMTRSAKATQLGLSNVPTDAAMDRLVDTVDMLQRIRDYLGSPMTITSGYRSPAVNKAVGGVTSSDHEQGMAADFVCPGYGTPYKVAKALAANLAGLGIGQLIYERVGGKTWVHVSTRVPAKIINRVITASGSGFEPGVVA